MKLYTTSDGRYHGTQADAGAHARDILGETSKSFHTKEVPTDKGGLIAYLNTLSHTSRSAVEHYEKLAEDAKAQEPVTAPPSNVEANTDISVEEAIHDADFPRTIVYASCALSRLQEHVNSVEGKRKEIVDLQSALS